MEKKVRGSENEVECTRPRLNECHLMYLNALVQREAL